MKINIWKYTIDVHRRPRELPPYHSVQDFAPSPNQAEQQESFDIKQFEVVEKVPDIEPSLAPVVTREHPYSRWERMKLNLGIIAEEAFHVFLVTYLFLLLVETIKPDFVSYFFNLNILLGVVLATGIVMAICTEEKEAVATQDVSVHWKYIATISIAGALLIYYKTEDLRWLSIVLTILTGGIIFLLSYIISIDSNEYT